MKVTVVPAQVTSVEDRIAGNLSLSQLLLLATPIFASSLLYVILPPSYRYSLYKIVLITCLFVICAILAIRIRSKILLIWLTIIFSYNVRPRYYVFNKLSSHGRETLETRQLSQSEPESPKKSKVIRQPLSMSIAEVVQLQNMIADPVANLTFETKKGSLYVHITEVK